MNVRWYKKGGRLSSTARIDSGTLIIPDTTVDDSGIYICQANSGQEIVSEEVTVAVGSK